MGEIEEIKIKATLDCIKDSETILNGEYYIIHSDFVIALEEEIKKINKSNIIIEIKDDENIKEYIKQLQQELERYKNIVDEFINKFEDFIETMEYEKIYHSDLKELLNKLKELKGE